MNNHKLLSAIIFLILGIMTACGLTATGTNNKAENGTIQNNVTADNKQTASGKAAENKSADSIQTKSIEIFDGRDYETKNTVPSTAENSLVKEEVRIRAGEDYLIRRLRGLTVEFDEEFSLRDVAAGSFTKSNAKQKAYLYRYSYTNGVVIVEDEKVVEHFSGDPGDYALYFRIKSSPDANRNGLSEIVLLRNVEDTEQISAHLFEFNKGNLEFLGQADLYGSNVEGGGEEIRAEKVERTGYVVSVQPSANPTFIREKYKKIGSGKWVLTGKAEKFSWDTKIEANLTNIR